MCASIVTNTWILKLQIEANNNRIKSEKQQQTNKQKNIQQLRRTIFFVCNEIGHMECALVGAIGDADTCKINAGFCIISFENNWKINPRWNWCSAQ